MLFEVRQNAEEAYEMMKSVYGSHCLGRSNIFRWYGIVRDGREDIEDAPRASEPRTSRTEENMKNSKRNPCSIRETCFCKAEIC
jgi:hypothetical protein